jgi:hypothetical protein
MWIIFGFLALGLLIGNLIGLTAESVVISVLGLLFAFGGGSIIAFIGKLSPEDRQLAGKAILALSFACLVGVYSGIGISEWQILSPPEKAHLNASTALPRASIADKKYLRSALIEPMDAIDTQLTMGDISSDEAYKRLFELVKRLESTGEQE